MTSASVVRLALLSFLTLALASPAFGLDAVLRTAETPLRSGQAARISLFVFVDGPEGAAFSLPRAPRITLSTNTAQVAVPADCRAADPLSPSTIEPGRFVRYDCAFDVPVAMAGEVLVALEGVEAPPIRLDVEPPEGSGGVRAIAPPSEPLLDLDALVRRGQTYMSNIGLYQPIYFLLGTPLSESKFQLSFKYRFFNEAAPLARNHPWVTGFHLGYTQTSFWDLGSNSRPFEDTSYKPEIFFRSENFAWKPRAIDGLFVQAGVLHESNGRGEEASRSTNLVYVSPVAVFFSSSRELGIGLAPRIKIYFDNSEDDNPDLPDYRGYFELDFRLGKTNGLIIGAVVRPAKRGTSFEVDVDYPLSESWLVNAQIYVHAQYVDALGESLLHYRERTRALRFGISFVR